MVRKIFLGIVVLILVLVVVIATRPSTFRVERSITIAAPPENAFAQVNDFHKWGAWSPWEKMDLQMKKTFEGPPAGTGAAYAWAGNDKVGEGRMTIERSDKPSQIGIRLEFLKPFAATCHATFTFAPVPEGTKATWVMEGHNNFMAKAFSLVMNMDKSVGGDFERGLASLKTVAEGASKPATNPAMP
jgi:hypothetical protein